MSADSNAQPYDVSGLVATLGDSNGLVRQRAREALVELGQPAVPALRDSADQPTRASSMGGGQGAQRDRCSGVGTWPGAGARRPRVQRAVDCSRRACGDRAQIHRAVVGGPGGARGSTVAARRRTPRSQGSIETRFVRGDCAGAGGLGGHGTGVGGTSCSQSGTEVDALLRLKSGRGCANLGWPRRSR